MYAKLLPIIVPVFACAGLGYFWARAGWPFEREFITRIVMNIGAPALVLNGIAGLDTQAPDFMQALGIAFGLVLACGILGWFALKLMRQPQRSYLPPVVFGNVGNLGLPLCLFAFGAEGLGLAVAFYLVGALAQFIIGPLFQGREPAWSTLVRTPIIYAAVAGLAIVNLQLSTPLWLDNTLELLADIAIPLMLLALGHALGSFRIERAAVSAMIAALRLALGFGIGMAVVWLLELEGTMRGVVIIQAAMPVAVFNFLLAARYARHPEDVAGSIVISTLISFLLLPPLVLLALAGVAQP